VLEARLEQRGIP
jgi:hypothetical protein